MKFLTKAFASIALIALPTVAQAQFDMTMTLTGQPIAAGIPNVDMGGGQFTATTDNASFANLLTYCIDNTRPFQFDTPYLYRVYTFQQYVAAVLPASFHTKTIDDLNQMAKNTGIIALNGQDLVDPNHPSNLAQVNSWAIFGNLVQGTPDPLFDNQNFRVLVSVDALNAQGQVIQGTQTFITTVPEPSTYLLMATGLMAVAMVARRRKQA